MANLLWMQCFVRAVETGSFSAVARELGIGQPNVSRHINSLEQHLGVKLMQRTTRKLSLTPEGERYYAEVRRALDTLEEAKSIARGHDDPRGLLRVACAVSLTHWFTRALVPRLLEENPGIELDLLISDEYVDLVGEGVDFAVRAGALKISSLRARRVGTIERACVATPRYLSRHSEPRTPADLLQHTCILYTLLATGNVWSLGDTHVAVSGRYRVNSLEAVRTAVLEDMGVGYVPAWLFENELRDGTVKALLTDYPAPPSAIHVLYPARRLLSRRASLFVDAIAEAFAAEPLLNEGSLARLLGTTQRAVFAQI